MGTSLPILCVCCLFWYQCSSRTSLYIYCSLKDKWVNVYMFDAFECNDFMNWVQIYFIIFVKKSNFRWESQSESCLSRCYMESRETHKWPYLRKCCPWNFIEPGLKDYILRSSHWKNAEICEIKLASTFYPENARSCEMNANCWTSPLKPHDRVKLSWSELKTVYLHMKKRTTVREIKLT